MTSIAVPDPLASLLDIGSSVRRLFGRWYKPEYTVLAGKFVAGAMAGAASEYLGIMNLPSSSAASDVLGFGLPFMPAVAPYIADKVMDVGFKKELVDAPNPISPRTMGILSTVASYTGYMVGFTAPAIAQRSNAAIFCSALFNAQASLAMIAVGLHRSTSDPSNGPPTNDLG